MERARMRKFEVFAKIVNLGAPQHREQLEEALSGCANLTTRARLRSRIQRGARA